MAKLLLVDDNEMSGDMIMFRLEKCGYEVVVAQDALAALARARSDRPDLILMDLVMPGMDGWEATRRLKSDPATAAIPIVALSGHCTPEDREEALAAGCDEYEAKPPDWTKLRAKIDALIPGGKPRRAEPAGAAPVSGAWNQTPHPWGPTSAADDEALKRLRHDLRTPLNQIIGYTEMLIETAARSGPESFAGALQRLHDAGSGIWALLNEGLAPWRLEAGKVDLFALRGGLVGPLRSLTECRDHCEAIARTLRLTEPVSDLDKIALAAAELRKMLEAESFTQRYPGDPAAGSIAAVLSAAPFPGVHDGVAAATLCGHILVVEDDARNSDVLVRRLERMGFTTTVASDGLAALDLLRGKAFDLVLLDVLMPVLDGFQTLERLKAEETLRDIPVIMVTALDEVAATVRCIEAGAEDYVAKPFNAVILRARIGASLERKRLRDHERRHLEEIRRERDKSERLLLNVLPRPIAERLKRGEQTIADAVTEATVLVADIVNFTRIAAGLPPAMTVSLLNQLFSEFDELVERMGVEKVKTIGDAYMAVGGVPLPVPDHATRCGEMAMAMLEAVEAFNVRAGQRWQIRIGIHSGSLVAGVIGSKKFAYDLWGDTVNIASRLESHGEAGTVQVSDATARLLQDDFVLEPRGPVELKNRGEMMLYRIVGRKAAFAARHRRRSDERGDYPAPRRL